MQTKLILFLRLKPKRRHLLIVGIFLAIYSYFLFSFNQKKARFGEQNGILNPENADNQPLILDIRFVIKVLSKYVPWNFVCRHQAWIASFLLKKQQIPYTIYVGFKKNPFGQIEGHAWTLAQNIMVSGFCNPKEFTIQATYVG